MMRVLLFPHGGSGNRGCEAIVRSTLKMLEAEAILFSSRVDEDRGVGLDKLCSVQFDRKYQSRVSISHLIAFFRYHILKDKEAFDRLAFQPIFKAAKDAKFVLSIGGDNYCYGDPGYIYLVNKELRKRGVKTVLWGCSIEPESLRGQMLQDLKGYNHIIARESITYNSLLECGISQVSLFPDPAFLLDRVDLPLPDGFVEGNTVGLNVSPMIISKESSKGIVLYNYISVIDYILNQTDMHVALIPHVVWSHSDDRIPLTFLYEKFKDSGRIVLLGNHQAAELKGFIARCRFIIAARTHASIAAYSQQVPTLVVGYSVKARGIAKDIFGTWNNFVLPVQSLKQNDSLLNSFRWLLGHEEQIRVHYSSFIPDFNLKASGAADLLEHI